MKQTSKKFVTVFTVILLFAFSTQNFAQLRDTVEKVKYDRYVGNLKNGINSNNNGLKICAIKFTALYQISENAQLLVSKYKVEKNEDIKNLIAFALYMIGDQKALEQINVDEKSLLKNISLNMIVDIYKLQSGSNLRHFEDLSNK